VAAVCVQIQGSACDSVNLRVTQANVMAVSPTDHGAHPTWRRRRSLAVPAVFAGTVAAPGGRIFVISGNRAYDGGMTNAVRVYDPKRDTWSLGQPIPTPRSSPGAALGPDGEIYVLGGSDPDNRKNVVEAYDPVKDSWRRLTPMPTARDAPQAVTAVGADGRARIYVLGGRDRSKRDNGLSSVDAYDPATDTWTPMAPMLIGLHAHVATLGPDCRIYVLGGTNATLLFTDAMQIYDPVKNTWIRGAAMPYGQECAAATFSPGPDGEVLMFGGWTSGKRPVRSAAAYSPRTGMWRLLPQAPTARAAGGAVAIQGLDGVVHVYVVGGTGEDGSGQYHPRTPCETTIEEYRFRAPSESPTTTD
jgi:N-acetylneuraminic acid mutarotase